MGAGKKEIKDPIEILVGIAEKLISDLRSAEWEGVQQGPGSGPMFSGNDGPLVPACPFCGGLKEKNGGFVAEAVGHRKNCRLAKLIGAPRMKEKR